MVEQIISKRVYFSGNGQARFLNEMINRIGRPCVAGLCGVDKRTFYDWRRGKYLITYDVVKKIVKRANAFMPLGITVLPEYWYVRKGAKRGAVKRNKLYGNPGTPEGRRKGGLITVNKFSKNICYAKRKGFIVRKEIRCPPQSALLAEFIGIMLGDGSINKNQAKVTLSSKTDRGYAYFIQRIIKKLFNIKSPIAFRAKNTIEIMIYSRNAVDFLVQCGLKTGNKVSNQIDVPRWIFNKGSFIKACLRGLIDTDGGIYFHDHVTKGIKYKNIGLCFTNRSLPLLNSANQMFLMLGLSAKSDKIRHVSLYGISNLDKYMSIIGSNNIKNKKKIDFYKKSKI